MSPSSLTIDPLVSPPNATITVPGSKSQTNRALLCAALADGTSQLNGALFASDTRAMMSALGRLGVGVDKAPAASQVSITGCGGLLPPGPITIDVAQSGTTSRFMLALLSLGDGPYVLDGDRQLRARPFDPLVDALTTLGVQLQGNRLPITVIRGGLRSGTVNLSGSVSSQFLSGLLLAAPYARADDGGSDELVVEVTGELVSKPYVALTMATMASFGVDVEHDRYQRFVVASQRYEATTTVIEPDASAASYFFAAAAICHGRVRIAGLGRHSVQGDIRFVDLLERMGASVRWSEHWVEVTGGAELRGIDVDMADISDTAQTLAVVATFATTPTTVSGIGFIKNKETDRVAAVVAELIGDLLAIVLDFGHCGGEGLVETFELLFDRIARQKTTGDPKSLVV